MSLAAAVRKRARSLAIRFLSLRTLGANVRPGIRFICYHDVFDGEVGRLETQLRMLRRVGEFTSLDRAIALMESQAPLSEPLFTVTFDDGLQTTYSNAWPVLEKLGIPFSIFVVTGFVGRSNYMSWNNLVEMARSPLVTIGSHTVNHRNLMALSKGEVRFELAESKATIEASLDRRCDHFCCPWGRPNRDFRVDRDPEIATSLGYRSFLTTRRGVARTGDELPMIKRDVIHMDSSDAELRYFLW